MKKHTGIIVILQFVFCTAVFAQTDTRSFEIKSDYVNGVTYGMEVILPQSYDTSNTSYPVLYCTDKAFSGLLFPALYSSLRYAGETDEIIIVEISCTDDSIHLRQNRLRDFTPPNMNKDDLTELVPENADSAGGAGNYLNFIRHELIPYVESHFRADTADRGYFGYSYGGLFGVYAMLNAPGLFQKYMIGSPSLWYDDFSLITKLEKNTGAHSIKKIYISVGGDEIQKMTDSYRRLNDCLTGKKNNSLDIKSEIINRENHMSAIPRSVFSGLRFLYGNY